MDDDNQEEKERNCLLCGKKLSIYNQNDICFCHEVVPKSPLDKRLKKRRAQARRKQIKKKALK